MVQETGHEKMEAAEGKPNHRDSSAEAAILVYVVMEPATLLGTSTAVSVKRDGSLERAKLLGT